MFACLYLFFHLVSNGSVTFDKGLKSWQAKLKDRWKNLQKKTYLSSLYEHIGRNITSPQYPFRNFEFYHDNTWSTAFSVKFITSG